MRTVDLRSLFIAGVIGAAILFLYEEFSSEPKISATEALGVGFTIGAITQFGLRTAGVS